MKKRKRQQDNRSYLLNTFNFDMKSEYAIYKSLCRESLGKAEKQLLAQGDTFNDYKSWRNHIADKYMVYGKNSLQEFVKMLNLLLRQSKKADSFLQSISISIVSILLTMVFSGLTGSYGICSVIIMIVVFPFAVSYIMLKIYELYGNDSEVYFLKDVSEIINELIEQK